MLQARKLGHPIGRDMVATGARLWISLGSKLLLMTDLRLDRIQSAAYLGTWRMHCAALARFASDFDSPVEMTFGLSFRAGSNFSTLDRNCAV